LCRALSQPLQAVCGPFFNPETKSAGGEQTQPKPHLMEMFSRRYFSARTQQKVIDSNLQTPARDAKLAPGRDLLYAAYINTLETGPAINQAQLFSLYFSARIKSYQILCRTLLNLAPESKVNPDSQRRREREWKILSHTAFVFFLVLLGALCVWELKNSSDWQQTW
jgi:hypothetical protein